MLDESHECICEEVQIHQDILVHTQTKIIKESTKFGAMKVIQTIHQWYEDAMEL